MVYKEDKVMECQSKIKGGRATMHRSIRQGDGVAMWIVNNNNINWIMKKPIAIINQTFAREKTKPLKTKQLISTCIHVNAKDKRRWTFK